MVDDGLVLDVLLNEFAVVVGLALLSFLSQPSTLNPLNGSREGLTIIMMSYVK